MNLLIRKMTLEDIPAVIELEHLSFTLPWPERSFRFEVTDNPASRCWVAEVDNRVVGMVVGWLFVDEIQAADERNPRLRTHIRFSATEGSLTIDHILKSVDGSVTDYHVYMCGPLPMIQAFEKKFLALGLPPDQIHFEEFNFR